MNIMNQQDNRETNNTQILTEDLTINETLSTKIKGGPIYMQVDGVDGDVTTVGHDKWISRG
jgi:hypothetical protein